MANYTPLSEIVRDANKLASKRAELQTLLMPDLKEWAMNRAFYKGNQWVFISPTTSQVEALPTGDTTGKANHRVRIVDNQVRPGVNYWVSQLVKTRPVIGATPNSGSDRDIKSAQMAESLFDHLWDELGLKSKLQTALVMAGLSQGYWKISWDPLAGIPMKFVLGPDGQPIIDDTMADLFREELEKAAEQAGQDPEAIKAQFEKTVYVGEIKVEAIPGENVFLDLNASNFEDCRFAICRHALDPDEIQARFGKNVEPDSSPMDADISVAYTRNNERKPMTTRDVFIGYFKPQPALPKGRYVAWIEGGDNQILFESDWPFPFNDLPLVKFPGIERPNSPLDDPVVTDVRPLQKELNRSISQVVQHKDLTLKPQMIAPSGSLRERITDEPGAVFQFNPVAGLEPKWREMPGIPAYVFSHLASIQQRIEEKFNKIPSKRESMPARVDAGYSIELIQEAVADQLSPISNRLEVALARAGKLMALLAQKYYTEPRLLKIKGMAGAVQVKKFMNSDIAGGFSFYAEAETGLPKSRAGRQQRIKELVEMQILRPDQAWKHLDIADLKGLSAQFQRDEDHALREIEKLIKGEIINPESFQQAYQAVSQGMNPTTQAPMNDPQQEAPQILMEAALQPLPYENFQAHLEVLGDYMKSVEFENLQPDAQQRMVTHFMATLTASREMINTDPANLPKLSIAAKATTSAAVMAEVLRKHGIMVTDEQVAEQPLETAIYDSVDKVDAQATGNNPLDPLEAIQTMHQNDSKHQMEMAKAEHAMQLAHESAQRAADGHAQQIVQQEHLHQEKLAQLQASHEQKLQHANEMHQKKKKQKPSSGGG